MTPPAILVDGQMLGAVVTFRDITERQQAEETLRVSERRFRAIFEQSLLGLVLYAPDGLLLEANQAVLDTVLLEQAAGYNVLTDEQLAAAGVMDDIRRAFGGEAVRLPPLHFDPARIPGAPQGRARRVRGSLNPVKDETGAVRDVVAMVEDITEQEQAYALLEQRVEERTQELSALLEVSHDVASTLELQPLLALILDRLKTVVDYAGAAVFLLEGEELVPADYRGPLSPEQVFALRVPVAQAVGFQEVSRHGGPVIIDDLRGAAPWPRSCGPDRVHR